MADGDHRLRNTLGVFADPRAKTAAKKYNFHFGPVPKFTNSRGTEREILSIFVAARIYTFIILARLGI